MCKLGGGILQTLVDLCDKLVLEVVKQRLMRSIKVNTFCISL
jgi:hypothetical protein